LTGKRTWRQLSAAQTGVVTTMAAEPTKVESTKLERMIVARTEAERVMG
jgi:hypothetical protein